MPRVLCVLPNASEEISGVKFSATDVGMLSEEISAEQQALFLSIPGYSDPAGQSNAELTEEAERAALEARAAAVGLQVNTRWGLTRFRMEVAEAEEAAAKKAAAQA